MPWMAGALCFLSLLHAGFADETAEKGRIVFRDQSPSVISVKATLSMSMGGEESENVTRATATVIDPSGLSVLSLSVIDPALYMDSAEEGTETQIKIVSLKMLLAEDVECPAEVVLRDRDLDLAFVRPVQPLEKPMPFVDLKRSDQPELLDELVVILQLGQAARRAHSVCVVRVETVVDKPRRFYTIGSDRALDVLCSPVFTLENKFVGIGVMRSVAMGREEMGEDMIVIIVPAEDIRDAVKQVPAAGSPKKSGDQDKPADKS